jgi:hypothetical protein
MLNLNPTRNELLSRRAELNNEKRGIARQLRSFPATLLFRLAPSNGWTPSTASSIQSTYISIGPRRPAQAAPPLCAWALRSAPTVPTLRRPAARAFSAIWHSARFSGSVGYRAACPSSA